MGQPENMPTNTTQDASASATDVDEVRKVDATQAEDYDEKEEIDPSDPASYYRNFAPIAELNLSNWRQTERQLVRRLDLTLMPTLWLLYMNNYLDRTNIAQARLNTLDEDLNYRARIIAQRSRFSLWATCWRRCLQT